MRKISGVNKPLTLLPCLAANTSPPLLHTAAFHGNLHVIPNYIPNPSKKLIYIFNYLSNFLNFVFASIRILNLLHFNPIPPCGYGGGINLTHLTI